MENKNRSLSKNPFYKDVFFVIFIIGILEYLPIPFVPNSIVEYIQFCSLILPFVCLIILVLKSLLSRNSLHVFYLVGLLSSVLFSDSCRTIGNRYIIFMSSFSSQPHNYLLGTKMKINNGKVEYNWWLAPNSYESLYYEKNHGLKDVKDREVLEVIDVDWFVLKSYE